jgi:hypothetical protein
MGFAGLPFVGVVVVVGRRSMNLPGFALVGMFLTGRLMKITFLLLVRVLFLLALEIHPLRFMTMLSVGAVVSDRRTRFVVVVLFPDGSGVSAVRRVRRDG